MPGSRHGQRSFAQTILARPEWIVAWLLIGVAVVILVMLVSGGLGGAMDKLGSGLKG